MYIDMEKRRLYNLSFMDNNDTILYNIYYNVIEHNNK